MAQQDEFFGERRRSLEEAFFAKQNRKLLGELQRKAEREERKKVLAEASGLHDEQVLEQLADLGIEAETLAALSLVPLVEVAWADGTVDERERRAVLRAAAEVGIVEGEASHELLEGWLERRPERALHEAWKSYVGALAGVLDDEAVEALRSELLGRARRVAEASGGLLGFGDKVSVSEEAVLGELEKAFS